MGYLYVKWPGGGTPQVYGSQQTGAWPANYYADILLSLAVASAGDYICVSDSHSKSHAVDANYVGPSISASSPVTIVCVADANCDTPSTGATESSTSGSYDFFFNGMTNWYGVTLTPQGHIAVTSDAFARFTNCTLALQSGNDSIGVNGDNAYFEAVDSTLDFGLYTGSLYCYGGEVVIKNSVLQSATSGYINSLINNVLGNGVNVTIIGSDLTDITGNIVSSGASATDDPLNIKLIGCTLDSGVTLSAEQFWSPNHVFEAHHCSSASGSAPYQYYYQSRGGYAQSDTAVDRSGSTAFLNSAETVSLKCVTNASASNHFPFVFPLPTKNADLTSASSDTIRVYIACDSTLTDGDVWIEAIYPDGTNLHTYKNTYSVSAPFAPFRTPSALTADGVSTWNGSPTYKYYIDVVTSTGAECVPILYAHVAKASATIYFDTTIDAVA